MATTIEMAEPESVFLKARARQARDQLSGSLAALPRSLEHAISPRAWTARYPWAAMGTAVLGMFSLAVLLQRWQVRREADALDAAVRKTLKRSAAASRPVRGAGGRVAEYARSALRTFVLQPLKIAAMAHLRGLF
jgi:hypothetical protein